MLAGSDGEADLTLRTLTLVAAWLTTACAASAQPGRGLRNRDTEPAPAVPGTQVVTMKVDGDTRSYRLHIPATLGAGPAPLVVSLHGFNSNAAQQENVSRFSELADREGFIAAYPEGAGEQWRVFGRSDADVKFVEAMIDDIARRHALDRGRMMVNGISNGAQMAWRMACDRPGLFSVAGFVSGGYPDACPGKAHPPTIIFHGTADRLLPYDGRARQMAVPEFAAVWAGCPKGAAWTPLDTTGEATSVRFACSAAETVLYTIKDKGHSWPGSTMPANITTQDVDASVQMLAFFHAH
jgi:polyhydroxybutyrate depolymerase